MPCEYPNTDFKQANLWAPNISTYHVIINVINDYTPPELIDSSSEIYSVDDDCNVTVMANVIDNERGLDQVKVNITTPTGITGNYTMSYGINDTYYYIYNNTWKSGNYTYTVWAVDNDNNSNTSSEFIFNIAPIFGYVEDGNNSQTTNNRITGSVFTINEYGIADSITAYVYAEISSPMYKSKCIIFRNNDSKIIGTTKELEFATNEAEWMTYNFSDANTTLEKDTEYILTLWSNGTMLYYDDFSDERGRHLNKTYNSTIHTFPILWVNESRLYSIYCSYTADTNTEINNVSDSPDPIGFGFNVTINADVTDEVGGVDEVNVSISYPGPGFNKSNFTMSPMGGDTYEYIFNDTWLVGQYNYTIWAVDNFSNSKSSSGHSFNVAAQATINISTIKDTYGSGEYINITDPPGNGDGDGDGDESNNNDSDDTPDNQPIDGDIEFGDGEDWTLLERTEYENIWVRPYNETKKEYKIEHGMRPLNYNKYGTWTPIELSFRMLDEGDQAYHYDYVAGNDRGFYDIFFKADAQDEWPVVMCYNKSGSPVLNALRSKLQSIGYYDPSQDHAYEILQNVQSSQGSIIQNGSMGVYPDVFTGVNDYWIYTLRGPKENLLLSNQTKTVLQNNPPSDFGLSNQNSYLVIATALDYRGLYPYVDDENMSGNFTVVDTDISFKTATGALRFSFPIGKAYERFNMSNNEDMINRLIQYQDTYYLLTGIKASKLNQMQFPVVLDPASIGPYTITEGADDADVRQTSPYTVDNSSEDATTGQWSGVEYNSYWRFQNISVMKDALVTNCYLICRVDSHPPIGSGTLEIDIHTIYELNTSNFSQIDNPLNRTTSENFTEWDTLLQFMTVGYVQKTSPNFADAATELINITGWNQTFNRFAVAFKTNAPNSCYWNIATYENNWGGFGGPQDPPSLYMTYIPPNNEEPFAPIDPLPVNNSQNVDSTPTLSCFVNDPNDDILDVTYYSNYTHYNYDYGLYPDSNGSKTELSKTPVSAHDSNYKYVNDSYGETNDSDLLYTYFTETFTTDLYNVTNHTEEQEQYNIQEITVYARDIMTNKHFPLQPFQYANKIKLVIKSNGTTTFSGEKGLGPSWDWDSQTWTTNPHNESNPWTWRDLDDLEIGISMKGKVYDYSKCSQVLLRVKTDEEAFWSIGTDIGVQTPGTASYVATEFTEQFTKYWWYTIADDGEFTNTSEIWNFITGGPLTQFELTYPANNSYNETSPVNLNVTITSPSGQTTDITWYEYHTESATYSELDTQTDLGNGTHTYSWNCGDGYKRWYAEGQTGNWTANTTDPICFFSDDVSDDDFWDDDRIESYTAGAGNAFSITENSWVNFTYSPYAGSIVGSERGAFPNPSPNAVFWNNTHGMYMYAGSSATPYYAKTDDGGETWTATEIESIGTSTISSVWYDRWSSGFGSEKI